MAAMRHYFKKLFSCPPHLLLKKAALRTSAALKKKAARRYDCIAGTYCRNPVPVLQAVPAAKGTMCGSFSAAVDWGAVREFMNHRFNLLGSGWVHVHHGMQCKGFSGRRYDMSASFKADTDGTWLAGRINPSNLAEAQRIWSLVDPGYTPIDWHIDFKSGYRWSEQGRYKDSAFVLMPGADVILPWELARMQHLPHMALAFRLLPEGSEERDALHHEFRNQILDFIATNPPRFGVNWYSPMDIAIRAANWLAALYLFGGSTELPSAWQSVFFQSIRQHGKHLYTNPSVNKYNHYAAQLAGLYCIGLLCPFLKEADTWRAFAKKGLETQIVAQVRPDGAHIEESTSYHLLATDIFLNTGIVADSFNDPFSSGYRSTVQKMLAVIETVASSRYDVPQIGDNDDGFFIKPALIDSTHTRAGHLLRIGRQYAGSGAKWTPVEAFANILGIQKQEIPLVPAAPAFAIRVLESAGWAVLEDGPVKIVLCLGAHGVTRRAGHAHEDILSFTLYWKGLPVIVDPGAYVYTPDKEMRNIFRGAISHNQPRVIVDEAEWKYKPVFSRFAMPVTGYSIDMQTKTISAEAQYESCLAARKIQLDTEAPGIVIADTLQGSPHKGVVSLCLHPDVPCTALGAGKFKLTAGADTLVLEADTAYSQEEGYYSAGYGLITKTAWLKGQAGTISIRRAPL